MKKATVLCIYSSFLFTALLGISIISFQIFLKPFMPDSILEWLILLVGIAAVSFGLSFLVKIRFNSDLE